MTKTIRARIMLAITPSGEWEATGFQRIQGEGQEFHDAQLRKDLYERIRSWAADHDRTVYRVVEVDVPVPEPREKGVLQGRVVEGET